jgi:hypothetical protein
VIQAEIEALEHESMWDEDDSIALLKAKRGLLFIIFRAKRIALLPYTKAYDDYI